MISTTHLYTKVKKFSITYAPKQRNELKNAMGYGEQLRDFIRV